MRLAVLFSGGKDSTYAAWLMAQMGHEISTLVSIIPSDPHSWVFHTPNLQFLSQMAQAMDLPILTEQSSGKEESDLEALRSALSRTDAEGVVMGAIASDYQWDRINDVCQEFGLKTFGPLWRKDQEMLMEDMVASGIKAILVRTSAEGMHAAWLGRELDAAALEELRQLARRTGMNISGEGGEYETLVLDSPLHRRRLVLRDFSVEISRDEGKLMIHDLGLEAKNGT
ncbi:MAG: diphthine--ammonia ligase [Euryarchaeota archaeon]|mgnify:CR=1 FL=1|nr:diphthine--ammonia ligase [Euryarchaeota archaeon]